LLKNVFYKRNFLFPAVLFFALFSASLYSQTAAELEDILNVQAVNCSQAARFVLEAADMADIKDTDAAFAFAAERAWLPKKAQAEKPITLAELSFLIMKAFNLKGGMMYSLIPGPRYAYRSMVVRSFIKGASDPAMTVNGERFLLIIGNVLSANGDGL